MTFKSVAVCIAILLSICGLVAAEGQSAGDILSIIGYAIAGVCGIVGVVASIYVCIKMYSDRGCETQVQPMPSARSRPGQHLGTRPAPQVLAQ